MSMKGGCTTEMWCESVIRLARVCGCVRRRCELAPTQANARIDASVCTAAGNVSVNDAGVKS